MLFAAIEEQASQGKPGVVAMCALAAASHAGYCRRCKAETALRDRLRQLALAHRHYCYRRLAALLRREGWPASHKRVLRLTRQDNLLCPRRKAFVPAATDAAHGWRACPKLARRLALTGCDQLWVADLTYVQLQEEFACLAVVLDAHSRRAIGWALARHLQASLAVEALRQALASREVRPGLVRPSDRGVQHACAGSVRLLDEREITTGTGRSGSPCDNAKAESFMKTLKAEEVEGNECRTLEGMRTALAHFLEKACSADRLHSALGYRSPVEYEQAEREPQPREDEQPTTARPLAAGKLPASCP